MKTFEELLAMVPEDYKHFYTFKESKWTDKKKQKMVELANKLYEAGAINPLSWARSEVGENIPQFGRFLVLKNLIDVAQNTKYGIEDAAMFGDDVKEKAEKISTLLGDDSFKDFLQAYGRAVILNVITILDEGNSNMEQDGVSWYLSETDGEGEPTGRIIEALHEDFYEFNENEG